MYSTPISAPIPLATYMPSHSLQPGFAASQPAFHSAASASLMPAFLQRQTSSSSVASGRYDAYQQPTPLSTSSLEQGTVYRGVFHGAEPTVFAAPQQPHSATWAAHQHNDAFHSFAAPTKKLELQELTYQPTSFATTAAYAPIQAAMELPVVPSHVERYTAFYSAAVPAVILKALRIGFQTMSDMRVDFAEETSKGKFRAQAFTEDFESIQFIARVYKTGAAAPAPFLVEFQKRSGDSVAFFRLFQKMLKSCASIHHGPYETSFAVAGMTIAPVHSSTPSFLSGPLALPSLQHAVRLDLPAVSSLCNMVSSDCIETKRESAKCLANVSAQSGLFPPSLERQTSTPSAIAASKAIWAAVVNILTSGDRECARLGASILRNCLVKDEEMLLENLETDRSVVQHLLQRLQQDSEEDCFETREIKRQVAAVLTTLANKKGVVYLDSIQRDASSILHHYNSSQ